MATVIIEIPEDERKITCEVSKEIAEKVEDFIEREIIKEKYNQSVKTTD